MGRAKKNPEYDPEKVMEQFTNCIVDAYGTGTDNNSLRKISEKFGITLMKTRKILITAGEGCSSADLLLTIPSHGIV